MSDIRIELDISQYKEGEAEYDAADWCYRVVDANNKDEDGEPYVICLCSDKSEAEQIVAALKATPFKYATGEQIVK